jgi:hypothetical protein
MSKVVDMTGKKYGMLTIIERAENDRFGKAQWLCQCDCGNKKIINGSSIRKGLTVSCGCKKNAAIKAYNESKVVNEIGNIYGFLTVVSRNYDKELQKDGRAMWNCKCECGNTYVVSGKLLREGKVTSCGCRTQSKGAYAVEQLLQKNNINYAKEYAQDVRKEKIYQHHKARFDFAIFKDNKLAYFIEYDGQQHFEDQCNKISGWCTPEKYKITKERDTLKNEWCKENNIPLIRIPYTHLDDLYIEDLLLETSTFIVK